ncbi:hypothetical protein J1605_010679 [Eschrichtius robustus]|uniref:Uncharacterized protein n=1 Tax=Eschrichtius robustus TaxID=9764 RepID=A0AB34GNG1_ESCRO|nr:hypothetical protein J1605_010679 [Eschrichtius robustus]
MPRSNWAREPQLLSLRVWSLCSATREAAMEDEEVLTKPHYKKSAYSSIGYIAVIALLNLYMINLLYITNHNPVNK